MWIIKAYNQGYFKARFQAGFKAKIKVVFFGLDLRVDSGLFIEESRVIQSVSPAFFKAGHFS